MERIKEIESAIYATYDAPQRRGNSIPPSTIGEKCARKIWYAFRWIRPTEFDGRMKSLFATGNMEETRIVDDLRRAGFTVEGQQIEVRYNDLMRGNIDGIISRKDMPPHILEIKTHSQSSFDRLEAKGVQASKPTHYAQMQIYMHLLTPAPATTRITGALYVAKNKNTDAIYCERVQYDADFAESLIAKAREMATAETPPAKISESCDAFDCTYCDYRSYCHQGVTSCDGKNLNKLAAAVLPVATCRSCKFSSAENAPLFKCALQGLRDARELAKVEQEAGCNKYRPIAELLPFTPTYDGHDDFRDLDGKLVMGQTVAEMCRTQ